MLSEGSTLLSERSEHTFYSCQLRFPYVRVVRVSCVPFFPYTQEAPLKIILKIYNILEISGDFNIRGSLRFHIHNKKLNGGRLLRNARTDTRAQL